MRKSKGKISHLGCCLKHGCKEPGTLCIPSGTCEQCKLDDEKPLTVGDLKEYLRNNLRIAVNPCYNEDYYDVDIGIVNPQTGRVEVITSDSFSRD